MVLPARGVVGLMTLLTVSVPSCEPKAPAAPPATSATPAEAPPTQRVVGPLSESDAAALATMNDRLKEYLALRTKLAATLPPLPTDATPMQIDKNQRQLEAMVRQARAGAKQGDLFTPQAQPVIRRLMANVFGGPDGAKLKDSIMDVNPVGMKVTVNERYPDTVPVSNVPPSILQTLPRLGQDLEYRFVADNLIILDAHAHVIADFIPDVFPKAGK